jgi:hypothetical protein
MSYKTTGTIKSIGETKTLDNGAKVLQYVIDNGEQYNNIHPINLYKSADKLEHFDNFLKYNKVGDKVTVEWNVNAREWKESYMTGLNHWNIEKVDGANSAPTKTADEGDGLPF